LADNTGIFIVVICYSKINIINLESLFIFRIFINVQAFEPKDMARPKKPLKELMCKNCINPFYVKQSKKRDFCSVACSQIYTKSHNRDWLEKRNETNTIKYGCKSPMESPLVVQKYKQNLLDKYNVTNPFLYPEFKAKSDATILERYGTKVASSNPDIKQKISSALKYNKKDRFNFVNIKWDKIESYCKQVNMEPLFDKNYLYHNKIIDTIFSFKCLSCNNITDIRLLNGYLPSCQCTGFKGYSLIEEEIFNFISSFYTDEILLNNRSILPNRLEVDLYLPDINLAIEINGLYWHSESMGKYKDYHLYKTDECFKKNIQLIHIFDHEWMYKKPIIQSILLNKIGLTPNKMYARKCIIREISDTSIVKDFLNSNHLQGYCHSKNNIGLYYEDKLVSLMTFGKNRFKKNTDEIEMIRFCNKLNINVIGGASKLIKYFQNAYNPSNIISFADRRFSQGNLYDKLGFQNKQFTPPSYFYWKNSKILNRMSCQKHKLNKLLDIFDDTKSEYINMIDNGYRRVWDCGHIKYTYR
jgi:hypothetical protein